MIDQPFKQEELKDRERYAKELKALGLTYDDNIESYRIVLKD